MKYKTKNILFNILTKFVVIGLLIELIGLCFYGYIPDKLTTGLVFSWTIFSFWSIKLIDSKESN